MFKNLMNGVSLSSMMLRDADNETGSDDGKTAIQRARDAIAANVNVNVRSDHEPADDSAGEAGEGETDPEEVDEETDPEAEAEVDPPVAETAEEKLAQEASEAATDKEKRKHERVQKRIDKAVAAQRSAEAEVAKWKALAEANPDTKLTEEEVQTRAEAIAAKKLSDKAMEDAQKDFQKAVNKLATEAAKLDKDFDGKVTAMADELGLIPSRVIGILSDLDNGAEVLKFMVDDVDEAEKIYDLKDRPEKLAIALVRLSDKLTATKDAAKKPKPKPLSKVPDAVTTVKGGNVQSLTITDADTKNMETYIQKRKRQREEQIKSRGY